MAKINVKGAIRSRQVSIDKRGSLAASRAAYVSRNTARYGSTRSIAPTRTLAARAARLAGQALPKSSVVVIGTAPEGFGKQVLWDPADAGLAVIAFVAAGDPLGVMISGVKKTDTIEFVSATGISSFAEETKNKGVGAFIGVVAAGATVAASAFGAPALAPVIAAAGEFAKTQFEEKKVKTKRRDPFGEDPSSGHKARQEGGVIVSLPAARQIYYSGNDDHKERWIKEPGTRDTAHLPAHVNDAFFIRGGTTNKRTATVDGDIILSAWDHFFEDNFGSYRLHILLKRGSGVSPVVE